jgi:hypothetical protein
MAAAGGIAPGLIGIHIEPHILEKDKPSQAIIERTWGLMARNDPNVTFEEYTYWAKVEREEEIANNQKYMQDRGPLSFATVIKGRFSKGVHHDNAKKAKQEAANDVALKEREADNGNNDKAGQTVTTLDPSDPNAVVTEEEWKTASRALRTASWGTLFYLITTDILGWSSTP